MKSIPRHWSSLLRMGFAVVLVVIIIPVLSLAPQKVIAAKYAATQQTSAGHISWAGIAMSSDGTKLAASSWNDLGTGGYIHTSTSSGATWVTSTASGQRYWSGVAMSADGQVIVALDQYGGDFSGGYIHTSTDGGTTWATSTAAGLRQWGSVAMSSDGQSIAASVSFGGYIYTSTNGGTTWATSTAAGSRVWSGVAMSADGQTLAASAGATDSTGFIYTSTNGGTTWATSTASGQRNWLGLDISANGQKIAAVDYGSGTGGYIHTSTDGGTTWATSTAAGQRQWSPIAMSSDGSSIIAGNYGSGSGGFIYSSTDGGTNWDSEDSFTAVTWTTLAMSADGSKIAAASNAISYIYTGLLIPPAAPVHHSHVVQPVVSYTYTVPTANDATNPPADETPTSTPPTTPSSTVPANNTDAAILQPQIDALLAQIAALKLKLGLPTVPGTVAPLLFTRDLTLGSQGADVKALQVFLNTHGYVLAQSGPGSIGNETSLFGGLTKAALAKFQADHSISPAAGYFGPKTRGVVNGTP